MHPLSHEIHSSLKIQTRQSVWAPQSEIKEERIEDEGDRAKKSKSRIQKR